MTDEDGPKVRVPRRRPIQALIDPARQWAKQSRSVGILILVTAVVALLLANGPLAEDYQHVKHLKVGVEVGELALVTSVEHWVNDGLMALFFFVVGLEIKREFLVGELQELDRAAFPVLAALGGAAVPALIYLAFNAGTATAQGWGIPMATDIVFAVGILALLEDQVPANLRTFLLTVAIADDILAVLVIAVVYTAAVNWVALGFASLVFILLMVLNVVGVRHPIPYAIMGVFMWLSFWVSGVHPTVGGVIVAFTIPAYSWVNTEEFLETGRAALDHFRESARPQESVLTNQDQQEAVQALERACEAVETPLQRLEHELHPWAFFLVMPLFVLVNAGVPLGGNLGAVVTTSLGLGIVLGLILGKQLGMTLFAWAAVRFGVARRPSGITWRHIYGVSWLGGIGFTMSIFIANLAFAGTANVPVAKVAIMVASLVSGVGGYLVLRGARGPGESAAAPAGCSRVEAHVDLPAPVPDLDVARSLPRHPAEGLEHRGLA